MKIERLELMGGHHFQDGCHTWTFLNTSSELIKTTFLLATHLPQALRNYEVREFIEDKRNIFQAWQILKGFIMTNGSNADALESFHEPDTFDPSKFEAGTIIRAYYTIQARDFLGSWWPLLPSEYKDENDIVIFKNSFASGNFSALGVIMGPPKRRSNILFLGTPEKILSNKRGVLKRSKIYLGNYGHQEKVASIGIVRSEEETVEKWTGIDILMFGKGVPDRKPEKAKVIWTPRLTSAQA